MIYTDAERAVYAYAAGSGAGDPLAIRRRLVIGSGGKVNAWVADYAGDDEFAAAVAEEKLAPVARDAFAFPAGVTDAVVLEELHAFLDYLSGKATPQRSSPPSAADSGPGGSADESPTTSTSDSC